MAKPKLDVEKPAPFAELVGRGATQHKTAPAILTLRSPRSPASTISSFCFAVQLRVLPLLAQPRPSKRR
jgi:hypothetical protein